MKKHCYTLLVFVFSISSFAQSNTFIDKRDGKVYKTVKIGNQIWMAENLVFKADSCCWVYNNDQRYLTKYGYYYNWETAKAVCPSGWHLPSKEEFETLINNYSGNADVAYNALLPGGTSGFSAPLSGSTSNGKFYESDEVGIFWSCSPKQAKQAWGLHINTDGFPDNEFDRGALIYGIPLLCGVSVRCLRDIGINDRNENYDKDSIAPNRLKVKTKSKTFIDPRDGRIYQTVKIGSQTWMAENLVFKVNNPLVPNTWHDNSNCWAYDNDQNNVAKYGYLYNWETAKNVCPSGWHLPGKEDFETLINNCGDSPEVVYKALLPGGSSGFSVQFGGRCDYYGAFYTIGKRAYFWSSSPNYRIAWTLDISSYKSKACISDGDYRPCGFSVRCLQDN